MNEFGKIRSLFLKFFLKKKKMENIDYLIFDEK